MTISTTCQCVKNGYAAGSAPFQTCASQHSHFFVRFPGSLFSFEQTGLFPVHLFCISRTCFRSPERLDCMPLHLLTRSCTSRLFTAGKKKKIASVSRDPSQENLRSPGRLVSQVGFQISAGFGFSEVAAESVSES